MTANASDIAWQEANQQYLLAALIDVKQRLREQAGKPSDTPANADEALTKAAEYLADGWGSIATLEELCKLFGLSNFERNILLLCASLELDASLASLCSIIQGEPQKTFPTLGLALGLFPDSHWSALTPRSPLRRWRLIELGKGLGLMQRPLQLNERILHYLAGINNLDEELSSLVEPVRGTGALVPSHQQVVWELANTWIETTERNRQPILQLTGATPTTQAEIAWQVCSVLDLKLHSIAGQDVPTTVAALNQFVQLWERDG
ncbi:MAG: ATP-binding protein, partial [Cyanobacteria bacterium J06639_16]